MAGECTAGANAAQEGQATSGQARFGDLHAGIRYAPTEYLSGWVTLNDPSLLRSLPETG